MNAILSEILKNLLYVIALGVGSIILWAGKTYALPWLKTKLGEATYLAVKGYVKDLMAAAEQKFDEVLAGKKKSEWVTDKILEKWPALNREYVQTIIDGLMRQLENEGIINVNKTA